MQLDLNFKISFEYFRVNGTDLKLLKESCDAFVFYILSSLQIYSHMLHILAYLKISREQ